ncbi:MAG: winged helix-turn-helix domain-containing protein [Proteobacteria bacterium]|nr:winged helix-turn-helix domain-containing protein [Pseudomonadota bacterium]
MGAAGRRMEVLSLNEPVKGEGAEMLTGSKDDIAVKAWPERTDGDVGDQEIEQCIHRLRIRIEPEPSQPRYILNIRGYGYKLSAD